MMKSLAALLTISCLACLAGCPMAAEPTSSSSPQATSSGKPLGVPETSTGAPAGAANDARTGGTRIALNAENSKIEFVGSKANGSHTGGFKELSGSAALTEDNSAISEISVEITIGSMFTDNPMLTRHLLNADFFEANTYPKATFKTTSIEAQAEGENTHSVTGDLTMHGVTKSISFPAKVSVSGGKAGLESKFTIDRREFGITYGQGMVNNDVEITVRVNAG
jgi:polyisoprenoid-binding protein YceI